MNEDIIDLIAQRLRQRKGMPDWVSAVTLVGFMILCSPAMVYWLSGEDAFPATDPTTLLGAAILVLGLAIAGARRLAYERGQSELNGLRMAHPGEYARALEEHEDWLEAKDERRRAKENARVRRLDARDLRRAARLHD